MTKMGGFFQKLFFTIPGVGNDAEVLEKGDGWMAAIVPLVVGAAGGVVYGRHREATGQKKVFGIF